MTAFILAQAAGGGFGSTQLIMFCLIIGMTAQDFTTLAANLGAGNAGLGAAGTQLAALVGVVLAPVTWLFGPVTATNVALTLAPGLSAWACFAAIRPLAAGLLVPYFLWGGFATYLNVGIWWLNR